MNFKLALVPLVLCAFAAHAEGLRIVRVRPPAFVQTADQSIPLARGDVPKVPWTVKVGAEGGFVLEDEQGRHVSVIGPALLTIDASPDGKGALFNPIYGDYRIVWRESPTFAWSDFAGKDFEVYFEVGVSGRLRRVRNVGPSLRYRGETLPAATSLDSQGEGGRQAPNSAPEIALLRARHETNEQVWVPPPLAETDLESEKLNGWAAFNLNVGSIQYASLQDIQKARGLALGGSARVGRSFGLVSLSKWRRLDYLNAPRLLVGFDVTAFTASLLPVGDDADQIQGLLAGPYVGIGWVGLLAGVTLGYQDARSDSGFIAGRPWGFVFHAGYEFDTKEITETDLLIGLHGFVHPISIKAGTEGSPFLATVIGFTTQLRFLF